MFSSRSLSLTGALLLGTSLLYAGDLRISIPKRTKPTPVQQLNQDGVKAVEKHEYDKAKKLFYKAYLLDPNDPFTLNNLGYMAELDGQVDRAQRYYDLAAQQRSSALIARSNNARLEGKPVDQVAGNTDDQQVQINRYNIDAISLLNKDRASEADLVLQKALKLDPKNPFTLNNLGFAREQEGEYESALQYYTAAASLGSTENVQVAINKEWRGRPISEIASRNARALQKLMQKQETPEMRVARLNLRGVSAMNRNDLRTAREDFNQAYKLAPDDAFTLNNMGYLSELDGDQETAQYYYEKAREANRNGAHVTMATRKDIEGQKIGEVASNFDGQLQQRIDAERMARERLGGPVVLRHRDNTPVIEPAAPPPQLTPRPQAHVVPRPPVRQGPSQNGLLLPLPDNEQPGADQPNTSAQPAPQQKQGKIDNGIMMPLPDNEQPGAAQQPGQQSTPQQNAPQQNPPNQSSVPQQKQGKIDNGIMMPLPDNEQPK
ncbi:MAG TPA: tetratricopeptide repeat protein [Terriglobales bacterium]|nr:tetratricopeptide repeat protein [Terriglobales bacterium]